jgi:phosphoglycerate-specific signal transduction histidine kinase
VGFAFTLWRIKKSQTAVEGVKEQIRHLNAIQEVGAAIRSLDEIRRLHRAKAWTVLPDRYTSLKHQLIAIKGRTLSITQKQRSGIQEAIQQLSTMGTQVESALADGTDELEVDRMNDITSGLIDDLAAVLVDLQNEVDFLRH